MAGAERPAAMSGASRYTQANLDAGLPVAGRPRVVFLGDSITDAWPREQPSFFARKDLQLLGRGISGETTAQMLARFDADVLALQPRAVVILAGTNDIAENEGPYRPERTFDNLRQLVERARARRVQVVLCALLPAFDYPWRPGLAPAPKIRALNDRLSAYAREHGLAFVDYHGALRDGRDGLPGHLAEDGVHPNAGAYRLMSALVEPALQAAVREPIR
jgi:lysophospholipase L1-like esterase